MMITAKEAGLFAQENAIETSESWIFL